MIEEIRQHLKSTSNWGNLDEVADTDSLLEVGVIDSLTMVDLIAHLVKTYGIEIDEDDMMPENFDSISAIAQFVETKKAAG